MSAYLLLRQWIEARLDIRSRTWWKDVLREIGDGVSPSGFGALFSLASRHARPVPLGLGEAELRSAAQGLEGWRPERWDLLEAVRVALLLSRDDLAEESGALVVEGLFRYADEGETRALLRSLAFLPGPERFLPRARRGCRSNMRSVFEAAALDTPYPLLNFDPVAWNQAVIKCLFVEAPLWRMHGLDRRLSPELARMALDLADERRSAGRKVYPELWLCLGEHGGKRGLEALEGELRPENPHTLGRRAAAYGLARAGARERLGVLRESEADLLVRGSIEDALEGHTSQDLFRTLD